MRKSLWKLFCQLSAVGGAVVPDHSHRGVWLRSRLVLESKQRKTDPVRDPVFGQVAFLFVDRVVEFVLAFVPGILQFMFQDNLFTAEQYAVYDIGKHVVVVSQLFFCNIFCTHLQAPLIRIVI